MRLTGKCAVITGGGSGMGRAIALEFARQGARVVAADINQEAAEETAGLVRAANGTAFGLRVDVTESVSANAMAAQAAELLGAIHILVSCAGVRVIKGFLEHTDDDWKRMLDINLTGPFYCARAVLPAILAAGGGKVINIASIASFVGRPNRAAYCAAKAGVLGLTRALATDMKGRNVCVNAIAPGSIATPLNADPFAADGVDWGGETLAGRWGRAEEVALTAVFLASAESDYITGTEIRVDGGWLSGRARDGEIPRTVPATAH